MSRRRRKKKANKLHDDLHRKKVQSIIQLEIDTAFAVLKAATENNYLSAQIILDSAKIQRHMILMQPLPITKPDKYGKYKDYRFSGETIFPVRGGVVSPSLKRESIVTGSIHEL